LSRSGPIFPFVPAGWNVWHEPQPLATNAALPPCEPPAFAAFPCARIQASNACFDITIALVRITECPSPHSSVQTTG
jgi:hypothetical protein